MSRGPSSCPAPWWCGHRVRVRLFMEPNGVRPVPRCAGSSRPTPPYRGPPRGRPPASTRTAGRCPALKTVEPLREAPSRIEQFLGGELEAGIGHAAEFTATADRTSKPGPPGLDVATRESCRPAVRRGSSRRALYNPDGVKLGDGGRAAKNKDVARAARGKGEPSVRRMGDGGTRISVFSTASS